MKEIFFIIYKKNPILHAICVILIFLNLYLILNQVIYQTNLKSYEDIFEVEDMNQFYYYSSDIELSNNFYNELKKIEEIYPEAEVGYSLESTVKAEDGEEFSVIYMNPVLEEIQYKLYEGRWFSKENEIVVGRDAAKKFEAGSQLVIKDSVGESKKLKITGSLENPYVIEFNTSAEEMIIPFLVKQKKNILLTTNQELLDIDNMEYPRLGLILKITDKKTADSDKRLSCLTEIISNTKRQYNNAIGSSNQLQMLFTIAILMNMIILSVYNLDERKEFLQLAYVCGLKKQKIILLEILQVLVDYMMAIPVILLSKCIIPDSDMVRLFLIKYVKNFMSSQIIFICIFVVVYYSILNIRMKYIMGE